MKEKWISKRGVMVREWNRTKWIGGSAMNGWIRMDQEAYEV